MTKSRIEEMTVFAAVAAADSFSGAARRLGLSPSAVSKLVTRLEARLGVRLVTRSTHGLALTVDGSRYADACQHIVKAMDDAEAAIRSDRAALNGSLRVSCSGPLACHVLAPLLPGFRRRYPQIALRILVSDTLIDLIEERADLALRIGPLRDSALRVRRIGRTPILHVASPDYVRRHGVPSGREDLAGHAVLGFPLDGHTDGTSGSAPATDSGELLRYLALNGLGIARLARFHVADDLARGHLAELPTQDDAPDGQDVSAVFPPHRQPAPRVTAFVDYVVQAAKETL